MFIPYFLLCSYSYNLLFGSRMTCSSFLFLFVPSFNLLKVAEMNVFSSMAPGLTDHTIELTVFFAFFLDNLYMFT